MDDWDDIEEPDDKQDFIFYLFKKRKLPPDVYRHKDYPVCVCGRKYVIIFPSQTQCPFCLFAEYPRLSLEEIAIQKGKNMI